MPSFWTDRFQLSRVLLPLTAAALALPALWIATSESPVDGGERTRSVVKRDGVADVPAAAIPQAELQPWASAGSHRGPTSPVGSGLPLRLRARKAASLGLSNEAQPDLGVVVHGSLECADPDVSGAVLLCAIRSDGYTIEELGSLGSAYSLHGLDPGEWQLVLRGPSILEHRTLLTVPALVDEFELDLEVEPMPAVEVLFVTSWGERLENALAEVGRDAAGMPRVEVVGAEFASPAPELLPSLPAGRFRLAALDAGGALPPVSGWIELSTPLPVEVRLVQAGAELERRRVERLDEVLQFVVDPLEESGRPVLTGLLVDAAGGDPIEDAIVELFAAGEAAPVRSRRIGAGGRLRMAGIGGGDWVLSVWSAGRAHTLHAFRIEGEADYALGAIELRPAHLLDGRLVGPDGRPLANRSLRWFGGQGPDWLALGYGREAVRTDAGGMFAIGGVPEGRLSLIAGGDVYAARAFELEVDRHHSTELRLELSPGVPVEFAVRGDLDASLRFAIRDAQGRAVFLRPASVGRALRAVLAPGEYVAEVCDGPRLVASRTFQVETEALEVVLEARAE